MTRSAPRGAASPGRLRHVVALGWAVSLVLAACGGAASDGGNGGGGGAGTGDGAYDQVIQQTRAALGNAMLSGTVEAGPTLKITLDDLAGKGMAKLFLCSNIRGFLEAAGFESTKVVIVNKSGTELATSADCSG